MRWRWRPVVSSVLVWASRVRSITTWLEAHNDYIFAIIGEELGLLGTLAVLLLYVGLVYCAVRIMLRTTDPLVRLATGGIMIWLTSQAIINMGMVSRILPVIGVPLPFVSYGGSSLLSSLLAAGLLLAFARQTPLRGATAPSNIETQSVREVRRANAEWQRRTPLQDVLNQEEAARAAAGGHLLNEHNPFVLMFGPESPLRRWLGFAPDQQRELAREETARVKAEQKAEAQKQKASQKPAPQKAPAQPRTGQQARVAQKSTASTRASQRKPAQGRPAQGRPAQKATAQKQAAQKQAVQQRPAQGRPAQKATAQKQAVQQRPAQGRPAQKATAQKQAAQKQAVQQRPAQTRTDQTRSDQPRTVQQPAGQKRVQQPRGAQPRSAQPRPSGSLPAGLQPLHPEDRQRRAERQGTPRQGTPRQSAQR